MRSRRRFRLALLAAILAAIFSSMSAIALAARHKAGGSASAAAPAEIPANVLSEIHVFGTRPAPFALAAKSALLIDAHTGSLLYSYHEHDKVQPASLAKIMTFYLALEALRQGRIKLDTEVTISEAAWRLSMNQSVSRMFLGVGQKVAVRDLLYGLMVSSGNDAAVALAEYLGGSSEAFAPQMNEKAKALGLTETHFTNPDGLPTENEYTTAADMVKLGRALLEQFPDAVLYTGTKEFTFDKIKQRNFNTLLFYDARVNGIKTGHVAEAGYHLVASATSNGMTLVSALMGTPSMEKRRTETKKLLDWAFRTYATVHPDWHKAIPPALRVYQGTADAVTVAPVSDPYLTVERGQENRVAIAYSPVVTYLVAPVKPGQVVGQIALTQADKSVASFPVATQSAVAPGGFFKRLRDGVRLML